MRRIAVVVFAVAGFAAVACGCSGNSRVAGLGPLTDVAMRPDPLTLPSNWTAPANLTRYVDRFGWSFSFPGGMFLERSGARLRVEVFEATVASFPMRRAVRTGSTRDGAWLRTYPPRDRQWAFPAGGVAFRIVRAEGGPGPNVELPESRFPLRLSTFSRSSAYAHSSPRPLERTVVADGRNFVAQAWIAADATSSRRAELARIVSSLSFPRLRVGQTVGYGFRVFEAASHYPVGSFVRVRVQGQPFYLVHAPAGFYAVGWSWQSLAGGYKSRCRLRLDRPRKQFFCINMHARWDRVGRVLVRPDGASRGDPLNLTVAKIAWEGHVLLFPGIARFADVRYAHRLWPGWHPRR
jgi:hypothetical protein